MNTLDWPTKTLGEICTKPQYGFTASANADAVGPRFLRITDLRNGTLNWNAVPFCECSTADREKFKLADGDLVVARIGATTGRTSLVLNPPEAVFASYLIRFRPGPQTNPFFLYFYTQSSEYLTWIAGNKDNNLKGGVNATLLAEITLSLPPKPEQEKIAAVLWKIQRAIEAEDKLIATTRELKQAAMHQIFTRGLRREAQKESEIGPIPASWHVPELSKLFHIKHGYACLGQFFASVGKRIVMTPGHFREEGGFRDQREKTKYYTGTIPEEYVLAKNDLLLAMTEQTPGLLGSTILVPESDTFIHNQRLGLVVNLNEDEVDRRFLYHRFNFSDVRRQIAQTATGSKVKHTSPSRILAVKFGLPQIGEQRDIAGALTTLDMKISFHQRKRATLQDLFKTMLHQLMTGQIRVDQLDIDVSEVRL